LPEVIGERPFSSLLTPSSTSPAVWKIKLGHKPELFHAYLMNHFSASNLSHGCFFSARFAPNTERKSFLLCCGARQTFIEL
jgi:hypothetical protein